MLVHVVNDQPKPLLSQPHETEQEATDQQFSTEAYSALKTALHVLEAHVEHRMHIRLGDTAEVLIQLADELGCDHIVMGTRGDWRDFGNSSRLGRLGFCNWRAFRLPVSRANPERMRGFLAAWDAPRIPCAKAWD